ncbi:MAG: hypothetical protein J7539_08325 [Niabella sp.]|nr:hypothetical protein [Niabella sp.]
MKDSLVGIALFLIIVGPIVGGILVLVGIVQLFSKDAEIKQKGAKTLGIGFIIALVAVLIGFSICSGML